MNSLNRAGWLFGTLVIGFALGWSSATLREPGKVKGESLAVSSENGLKRGEDTLSGVTDSAPSHEIAEKENVDAPAPNLSVREALREAYMMSDLTDRIVRMREIIRTLPTEQMSEAFAQVKKLPLTYRVQMLATLGSRWAEVDLQGALDFALRNGRGGPFPNSNMLLQGVVEKWAATVPSEAIAWVDALPPGEDRNSLRNTLLMTLGRNDPQAALHMLRTQSASWQGDWAVAQFFSDWAGRDPGSAAAAALEINNVSAIAGIAQYWAQENPSLAISWAEKISNASQRNVVMNSVIQEWAEADPVTLIAWSRTQKEGDNLRRKALERGIAQLAEQDLDAALGQIGRLPGGEERSRAIVAAAESLGNKDARSAARLLEQLDTSPERTQLMSRLCGQWGAVEPRAALEWFLQNRTPSDGDRTMAGIIGHWAQQSPAEALEWAQRLPAGEDRDAAMSGMAMGVVYQDAARGQQIFSQLSPGAQAATAEVFVSAIASQDLGKARAWAESLPSGNAQEVAFGAIGFHWAGKDVKAAAQWLGTLPPGRERDRAVMGFNNQTVNRDPAGAVAWALTIANETDRTVHVEHLVRTWLNTDAASARKWLNDTNQLSAAQKQRIQER